jgi:excisionase family DNA binding protein
MTADDRDPMRLSTKKATPPLVAIDRNDGTSVTQHEPLAVSVVEAARLLSLSRSSLYKEIAAGNLQSIIRRGRRLIRMDDLRIYLAQ